MACESEAACLVPADSARGNLTMATLSLSGIGKRFGGHIALSDVSLEVRSGEFICLLGASGCGKTTLLRIIAGLEQHDHGEILLEGRDLSAVPCHQRNIGMVFQSLALFPHLNVADNVAYGLKMQGVDKDSRQRRAAELLALVGLAGFDTRAVASLSGGQRQRVAIARALAQEPQLFLMDEPFSALDAGLRDRLQQEVKKLQQALGVTTVFVTHDQREAMALADRIVVLNEGRIEQAASPAEIYQHPASRYVADFIGDNNLIDIQVSGQRVQIGASELVVNDAAMTDRQGSQLLSVRPEQVNVSAIADHHDGLTGQLIMQRQVGALVEREIEVNGQLIKQTCFHHSAGGFETGQPVAVSWDWSRVWVVPA